MADKIKTSYQLKLLAGFKDGDTRTIAIDNPRGGLTATDIKEINALADGVLIGDKYGSAFAELKDAGVYTITSTELDIDG